MDAYMEVDDSNFLWEDAVVGSDGLEGKDFGSDHEEDFGVDEIEEDIEGDELDEEDAGVAENIEPSLGMEFSSIGEAQQFYKSYSSRLGFSVRINTHTKSKVGISSLRMVCSKQGLSKRQRQEEEAETNLSTPQKETSSRRGCCGAYIRFRRLKNGVWIVSAFNAEHNHNLIASPAKKRNLRSLKGMSLEEKLIVSEMRAQNVSASQIWHYLAEKAGGSQNLNFKLKDVSNQITEENRRIIGVDIETTFSYFRKKQEEDPEFFFAILPDDDGAVKNILWIDGRARRAYQVFGEVVTFDTTYNTNRYCMPLAMFIGVNHHWQSIPFGCCLLRNEQAINFVWLFSTWLQAMNNKAPISIITDQDPAMRVAIANIFPKTIHRCCQWHVMTKARDHLLVQYGKDKSFQKKLKAVINRSLTVADFEKSWDNMLKKYKLEDNKFLKTIFEKRAEWVPAYFRGVFFANMSTTQRSEGMNAVMKLLVDNHTCIYRFVIQLEKMVEGIWQKESDEDCRSTIENPPLWSINNIEVDARLVYTRRVYSLFKKILKDTSNGFVLEVEREKLYEVHITLHPFYSDWEPETHRVQINKTEEIVSCSCKGYEFNGLLCAHSIKVMQHVGMQNIPSKYIVKRWTKGANDNIKAIMKEINVDMRVSLELESTRYAKLYPKLMEIGRMVAKSEAAFKLVDANLDEMKFKVMPMISSTSNGNEEQPVGAVATSVSTRYQIHTSATSSQEKAPLDEYSDPPLSQCKGRKRRPQRLKPILEKLPPKRRTCSYCDKQAGHNLRSCPERLSNLKSKNSDS